MGQHWKTLLLVVVGAAVAGWLSVRMIAGGRHDVVVRTAAVETPKSVEATAAMDDEPVVGDAPATEPPAALAKVSDASPSPGSEMDESAIIARDLELLAQALVRDQRIQDLVLPRVNDVLDVPGTTQYRRIPDFWEPALAQAAGR